MLYLVKYFTSQSSTTKVKIPGRYIIENLIMWIRNSKQNKEKNYKWNRRGRYILSEHETVWKMKRKKELREFKWMKDKGEEEEEEEWEVNIMRVSVKGEERA